MYKKTFIILISVLCLFLFNCEPVEIENGNDDETSIVNITVHENCERVPLGTGSSIVLESFLVDKKEADTFFLIEGTISGYGNAAYSMTQGWTYGNGDEVIAQSIMYEANSTSSRIFATSAVIYSHTETGPQIMSFRYFTADGTATSQPFVVYNPNSTDDARLEQTCSRYIVWEIRQ